MHIGWPDVLIAAIVLIAALKGVKRGLIAELAGIIALVLAFIAPWFYRGAFDGFFTSIFRLSAGSAHIVAMFAVGLATYVAVSMLARVLGGFARLPLLGTGNAILGGLIGILKGLIAVWVVLYVALFFSLSKDVRNDLHNSPAVHFIAGPNDRVDGAIISTFPWFARPFAHAFFAHHRV